MKYLKAAHVNDYLRTNHGRGTNNGLTVSSYLYNNLSDKAKCYAGGYVHRLIKNLEMAVTGGYAYVGASARGSIAYYPTQKFLQLEM